MRNAGQTASRESLFQPGKSVQADGVKTGRGGTAGAEGTVTGDTAAGAAGVGTGTD